MAIARNPPAHRGSAMSRPWSNPPPAPCTTSTGGPAPRSAYSMGPHLVADHPAPGRCAPAGSADVAQVGGDHPRQRAGNHGRGCDADDSPSLHGGPPATAYIAPATLAGDSTAASRIMTTGQ